MRRRTSLQRPPAVSELRLHLADDITAAWQEVERELDAGALAPPFWAFAWAGGQGLARHLLDRPAETRGRSVLDLATGSGLCALAAGLAGARDVLAVDVDPVAGAAVRLNAAVNRLAVRVRIGDLTETPAPAVDVVLAGDVCYDRAMTDQVLPWLRGAARRGVRVLLGDPGRHYLPSTGLTLLSEHVVPTTVDLEGVAVRRVRVFAVTA